MEPVSVKRARILVVDDEPDIRDLLGEVLGQAGYDVSRAGDGRTALRAFYETQPDLVVLDVMMPELDGWETLERLRDMSDVPVLMLTARAGEDDKVRALRGGANDYVTKPFGTRELVARVEVLLRGRPATTTRETYVDGFLTIDFADRTVTASGRPLLLTPLEFRLLSALVRNANRAVSAEELLQLAWYDPGTVQRGAVKLYVSYLRRKLAAAGPAHTPIETVRGFGYRYRAPNASPPAEIAAQPKISAD